MKKNNHQKAFQAQSRFRQILNWLFDRYESKCSTRHDHKNEIAKAIDDYFDDDWDKQQLIELIAVDCENSEGKWYSTTEIKIDKLGYVIKDGVKSKEFWDGKIVSDKKPKRIKIRNISGDETIKGIE